MSTAHWTRLLALVNALARSQSNPLERSLGDPTEAHKSHLNDRD